MAASPASRRSSRRGRVSCRAIAFDDDTALDPDGDGAYRGVVDARWWTPRGPLGGYVMALVMRGLMLAVNDPGRQPRSLTVHFLRSPQAGPVTVRPVVERAGRSVTTTSARLEQEGRLLALALAAFSTPWPSPELADAPMPDVDPPGDRSESNRDVPNTEPPPFLGLLSMQRRFGAIPFSGADRAETGGWLGLREERPVDALTVLVLADAWFPALWPRLHALAPAPTMEMSVYFRTPLPLPDSLLLGRFRTRLVRDGFFEEDGELWSPDGTLVAQSRQLALLLGAEGGEEAAA
jgi:acyl-CoA thioesterase